MSLLVEEEAEEVDDADIYGEADENMLCGNVALKEGGTSINQFVLLLELGFKMELGFHRAVRRPELYHIQCSEILHTVRK